MYVCVLVCDSVSFTPQTFKLFEKVSEQDRQRRLSEMQKREDSSASVPPAVQELEVATEPQEEPSREAAQVESPAPEAAQVSAAAAPEANVSPQPSSSSSAQAAAASTKSPGR